MNDEISKLFTDELEYLRNCGVQGTPIPSVYLIMNDNRSGNSKMVKTLASTLYENGLFHFGSLDLSIERTLSGKPGCVEREFSIIHSQSVFSNTYCGVLGLEITDLVGSPLQKELDVLLKHITNNLDTIIFVLFVNTNVSVAKYNRLRENISMRDCFVRSLVIPHLSEEAECEYVNGISNGIILDYDNNGGNDNAV